MCINEWVSIIKGVSEYIFMKQHFGCIYETTLWMNKKKDKINV